MESSRSTIQKRVVTIIAWLIGLGYLIFACVIWAQTGEFSDFAATFPTIIFAALGFLFNSCALFLGRASWNVLAGILYFIADIFAWVYMAAISWLPGVVLLFLWIMSFFGYWRMRLLEKRGDYRVMEDAGENYDDIYGNRK